MKRISFFILLFFFLIKFSYSQDTLFMRNNTILLVKVMEVFPSEVKYKRFDVLDGPVYTESKAAIKTIKYANGFKEEFKLGDAMIADTAFSKNWKLVDYKIEKEGSNLIYKGKRIGERELTALFLDSNDKTIIKLGLKMQRAKRLQPIGFTALPFVLIGVGAAGVFLLSGESDGLYILGGCAIIAIPLGLVGIINNHNHKAYKEDAIENYNIKY